MEEVAKIDKAERSKKAQAAIDQKMKAVEFLRTLDIFKPYIDGFVKNDNVCFFERFGGFWVYQEPEIEAKMRDIEEKYGCKVYAITHEKIEGDDMWSSLLCTEATEVKDNDGKNLQEALFLIEEKLVSSIGDLEAVINSK